MAYGPISCISVHRSLVIKFLHTDIVCEEFNLVWVGLDSVIFGRFG
jgi:hypothetical protein